jgi:hypothetical protein
VRQPEPLLRCSPADFDVGSARGYCDGWFDDSTFLPINIKSFVSCDNLGRTVPLSKQDIQIIR